MRCPPASPLASLHGATVHVVEATMTLRVVPPRVHQQATLAAQDVRERHLAEPPPLETLPQAGHRLPTDLAE